MEFLGDDRAKEELYKEWKEVGQGRNLEVHHKKDLRRWSGILDGDCPENVRKDKMKTSQEKYHEDQTNVEDDEEEWNDQQYQRKQINQEE